MKFQEAPTLLSSLIYTQSFVSLKIDPKLMFSPKFAPKTYDFSKLNPNTPIQIKSKGLIITWTQIQFENEVQYRFLSRINSRTSDNYSLLLFIKVRGVTIYPPYKISSSKFSEPSPL